MEPSVSVIVPTYNDRERLEECLESLRRQDWPEEVTEIIVVDDGSTDGTEERIRTLFPGVTVVRKGHGGADDSRNHGVRRARGEIVAFIDSDCTAPPGWLAAVVGSLRGNEAAAVGGRILHRGSFWSRLTGIADFGEFQGLEPRTVDTLPTCGMGIRRRVFEDLEFDVRTEIEGDVIFSLRLRESGMRLLFDPSIVVFHHPAPDAAAFFRRARRYGAGFVRTRMLEPSLSWSGFVRSGAGGVALVTLGRTLLDWRRLLAYRRPAGFTTPELFPAVVLLFVKRLVSLPAAVRERRSLSGR